MFCKFSQKVIKRVFNEHDLLISNPGGDVVWHFPGDPGPAPKAGSVGETRFTPGKLGQLKTEWNVNQEDAIDSHSNYFRGSRW